MSGCGGIEQEAQCHVLQRGAECGVVEQRRRVFRGTIDDGADAARQDELRAGIVRHAQAWAEREEGSWLDR